MTAPTITGATSAGTTTPLLIRPHRTTQGPGTIVHDIPGSPSPWVSLAPARTREGTLDALYGTEENAEAARILLTGAELFEITYPGRESLEFTFTVHGVIDVELQRDRQYWVVRVPFREVT
jgi:hypothetical protein